MKHLLDCLVWYVHFLYRFGYSSAEKNVWTGSDFSFCLYRCIFCVAESYEKRFVVAVLQECHKMVVCRYVGDFLFVPSSV